MIDLHSHSSCSDGSESPERVVELAAEAGCSSLALTDHDGLFGVARASAHAKRLGIGFVPGCEVSCAFSPGSMHVLCYFIEPIAGPLQMELDTLRVDREKRNEQLVERLGELGIAIDANLIAQQARGATIGRPHFAAVLVQLGVVASIDEAFTEYLTKGARAYVPKARVSAGEIIDLTAQSGGASVLAHPLTLGLRPRELERQLHSLAERGLMGVECYYGRYGPEVRADLVALARKCKLVPTGGSDFHGSYKPDLSIGRGTGDLEVPDEVLDELIARRPASSVSSSS